eukprot:scaffold1766_cov401-Prasinococcus_capsulatus_cf.AAC.10
MLAFVSNTQLLRCTYVSDQDMLPICIALKCNAYIRTVEILGGMGDNGAIHLAEALKHNCNIVHVTISNCNVREMGARALAAWLRASPNAASFCLKGCDIRDCGAEEIADAASGHRRLSTLDLSRNNIGCAGAAALAMALKSNRHLSSLSLERHGAIMLSRAPRMAEGKSDKSNAFTRLVLNYAWPPSEDSFQ